MTDEHSFNWDENPSPHNDSNWDWKPAPETEDKTHPHVLADWDDISYHLRKTPEGPELVLEKDGDDYIPIGVEATWEILEDLINENTAVISETLVEMTLETFTEEEE